MLYENLLLNLDEITHTGLSLLKDTLETEKTPIFLKCHFACLKL